jgi:hypothetical protein
MNVRGLNVRRVETLLNGREEAVEENLLLPEIIAHGDDAITISAV